MTTLDLTKVAPWNGDTPGLLGRTLSHIARAHLVMPDYEEIPLDLEGGTLDYDETRAPRVQATLTCKVPDDAALLDRIDPRTGARLIIEAGYRRPDQLEDVSTMVDLGLRTRTVSRPADTMTLTAAGDEALLIDNAPSNGGAVHALNLHQALQTVVATALPWVSIDTTGVPTGGAIDQAPMGDKWTLAQDLADQLDANLYDDGQRNWLLRPTPVLSTPALELKVGAGGTIIESEAATGRELGWFNRVFLTYKWVTTSGGTDTQHSIVSVRSVTSGPYAATTGNVRLLEETREIPTTQAQADAAATALVKRTVTRGRSFTLRAVSAYWLRPGHTVNVTLPLGGAEDHLVTAVSFDLKAGTMRVTTRLPDNTGSIGA